MQIFTYRDFLKDKSSLTFEQAEKIYDNLRAPLKTSQKTYKMR